MARIIVLVAVALLLAMAASGVAAQGVGSTITQSVFDRMLPNRNNSLCPAKGFYTYDAFIAAAKSFPAFGTTGSAELMKRELAAFFGQTSHQTTGGTRGAGDQFEWGYCFKEELSKATSPPYYGRGPIQLTGPSDYQLAGNALGVDLMKNPDLVSTDPVISFKTAIWFWMTPKPPTPSCHDIIKGQVINSGYGVITLIIEGVLGCRNSSNFDRVGFYKRFCDMLGIGNGTNLDCVPLSF